MSAIRACAISLRVRLVYHPPDGFRTAALLPIKRIPCRGVFEVKPSPRYGSQKSCEAALKKTEAVLKKRYPDRYPLVGNCEEFR
jgi:hypothetical protein